MVRFNGWQRIWVVLAVILFMPSAILVAALWPSRDAAVVRDLAATECAHWHKLPARYFPERYPSGDEPCNALQAFLFLNHADVRSVEQYDSWLAWRKMRTVALGGLGWASVSIVIYFAGWSVAWIRRGFQK